MIPLGNAAVDQIELRLIFFGALEPIPVCQSSGMNPREIKAQQNQIPKAGSIDPFSKPAPRGGCDRLLKKDQFPFFFQTTDEIDLFHQRQIGIPA